MFEQGSLSSAGPGSVFEEVLRSALRDLAARRVWIVDYEPHGRRGMPPTLEGPSDGSPGGALDGAPGGVLDGDGPRIGGFRRLLEDGAAQLEIARVAAREQARQAAVQARALAAFARYRPARVLDRPEAEVGAAAAASRAARPAVVTEVSEWAVDEVSAALGLPARTAGALLADSLTLVEQLPATLAALEAGVIDWPRARMLTDQLGPLTGGGVRGEVEARVLAGAAGRTLAQLRAVTRRAVLHADAAAAAQRLAAAVRQRAVRLFPDDDGMATLSAAMSTPVAAACYAALEAYAHACVTPGDERSKGQRMVDCLAERILRPGVNPPVQVQLTLVAGVDTMNGQGPGSQEPGEVNGEPVPALLDRELAHTLGLLPRPEPMAGRQPGERTEPADTSQPEGDLTRLLGSRTTAGTALVEPPTIAVVEEVSGELLALTDAAQLRRIATCTRQACRTGRDACTHAPRGPGLGPPGPGSGYAPSDRLDTFIRFRDRRCRFPGCRARAIRCDLDHTIPWPHGATSADNLCSLCRHHHRLSHQAPGWTIRRLPHGGLQWTTPGGDILTTHPPRYGTDDPPPTTTTPAPAPAPAPSGQPPPSLRERVLGRPRQPGEPDDDPPPF